VLLIVAGKIDKASHQQQVVQGHRPAGACGAAVARERRGAAALARARAPRAMGLNIDREALGLLAERVEGNLLAAVQELEKLRLLAGAGRRRRAGHAAVANSARFNLFA
jgi:DNA polymerase-3 subunit delta